VNSKSAPQSSGGGFDWAKVKAEIKGYEATMEQPDFWQNQDEARSITQKHDQQVKELESFDNLLKNINDNLELARVDQKDQDVNLRAELEKSYLSLLKELEVIELKKFLSGPHDDANAILAIHAGAGGTDAQDWAEMLRRMYMRFADQRGWRVQIMDESRGGEAGIKSSVLSIQGPNAYGNLKSEAGVHRLVRISPFDAEKMRHTSFALVEVLPELEEVAEVKIDPKDLRIDTFMSGGKGGQSVNTTYSAVRIVHIPTGITVTCQNERSQAQNKEQALKHLRGKLWHLARAEQQKVKREIRGEFKSAEWGNQARSYVLHPYKQVKDHRTGLESKQPDKVLDGQLDDFIVEYLKQQSTKK